MIRLINPGLFTSIQDLGRPGYRKMGVPLGGAMDSFSAISANLLLGKSDDAAVFEFASPGPELIFEDASEVVITGADMQAKLNGKPVDRGIIIDIKEGSTLKFGRAVEGFWGYMAINAGINTDVVLGSRGFTRGITRSYRLGAREEIPTISSTMVSQPTGPEPIIVQESSEDDLLTTRGPEFDSLPGQLKKELLSKEFRLSEDYNRMAYILRDKLSQGMDGIITSPVQPGTVQLTPSGQLIILMRDAQTTGGYSRVLQLEDHAINTLAQQQPGNMIRFRLDDTDSI